ncbi:MAG: 50S ribosomal protein L25 [Spirochaetales bacterium]|nr:50S ribosomal protein L25 [Spirochaetales bacterium]
MDKKTLTGFTREKFNKHVAGRLRREGKIPAVMYGSKGGRTLSVDSHEFHKKFHTVSENTIIQLQMEGETFDVLVKDYQEDIMTGSILHIDFFEIEKGKLLKTHVPIHLIGTAIGAREGGVQEQLMHEIEVECLPKNIPASIEVDITKLEEGASIHVAGLPAIEGVKFLAAEDSVVVTITHVRGVEELEAEAAGEAEEGMEEEAPKESEGEEQAE